MNLQSYHLPESWACTLMYGDESGMDQDQLDAINAFIDAESSGRAFHLVDVVDSGSGDFRRWHDASPHYPFAANVAEFVFDVD